MGTSRNNKVSTIILQEWNRGCTRKEFFIRNKNHSLLFDGVQVFFAQTKQDMINIKRSLKYGEGSIYVY